MKIGDRVERIEERETTGAAVVEIDGEDIEIVYDEGGVGWWPRSALRVVER